MFFPRREWQLLQLLLPWWMDHHLFSFRWPNTKNLLNMDLSQLFQVLLDRFWCNFIVVFIRYTLCSSFCLCELLSRDVRPTLLVCFWIPLYLIQAYVVGILYLIQHETQERLLTSLFKILVLLVSCTPYAPFLLFSLFSYN